MISPVLRVGRLYLMTTETIITMDLGADKMIEKLYQMTHHSEELDQPIEPHLKTEIRLKEK